MDDGPDGCRFETLVSFSTATCNKKTICSLRKLEVRLSTKSTFRSTFDEVLKVMYV